MVEDTKNLSRNTLIEDPAQSLYSSSRFLIKIKELLKSHIMKKKFFLIEWL